MQVPKGGSGRAAERGRGGARRGGAASWRAAPGPPPPLRGARRGCPDPFRVPFWGRGEAGSRGWSPKFVGCEGRGWRCTGGEGWGRGCCEGCSRGGEKKRENKRGAGRFWLRDGCCTPSCPAVPATHAAGGVGGHREGQTAVPHLEGAATSPPAARFPAFPPPKKHKQGKKRAAGPQILQSGSAIRLQAEFKQGVKPTRSSPQHSGPHRTPTRGDGAVRLGCY